MTEAEFTKLYCETKQTLSKRYPELKFSAWSMRISGRMTKTLGYTKYGVKEFSFSKAFIRESSREAICDVILHEFAHMIAEEKYHDYGHGEKWKKVCISIGGQGERMYHLSNETRKKMNKYKVTCDHCDNVFYANRKPRTVKYSCAKCCPTYSEKYLLTYTEM